MAVDATTCPIEAPTGSHAFKTSFYSKKDSRYSIKYELGVSLGPDTRICHVSRAYAGGFADVNISRECLIPKLEAWELVLMDKGYEDQGDPRFLSPVKDRKNGPRLTLDELNYNRAIYEKRDIVERVNKRV